MEIKTAEFVASYTTYTTCPKVEMAEYAFVGRSNVGKSSLINMLLDNKKLAKTSQSPGKTQLINHFIVNSSWLLADLPGYGYAKVAKSMRKDFNKLINEYILHRENMMCLFVLLDIRHEPQKNDLGFMRWLGEKEVPFVMVFTKADKISKGAVERNVALYKKTMLEEWEDLPEIFITSVEDGIGRVEILDYIDNLNKVAVF